MNREQRRNAAKMPEVNSYCTLKETVQIARATAEDAITDYQRRSSPLQVAISLQIEILKNAAIKAGIITEEEFKETYMLKAEEFNKMQREYNKQIEEESNPMMEAKVSDIEVRTEE